MGVLPATLTVLSHFRRLLWVNALLLGSLPTLSQAQITLDGSLGLRGPLQGLHYIIPNTAGQMRG